MLPLWHSFLSLLPAHCGLQALHVWCITCHKDNVETGAMRQLPTSACTCTVPVLALCTKNEGAQQRCSDNLCAEFGISVRL